MLKGIESQLQIHLKDEADFTTKLTTSDAMFQAALATKQDADRIEKDAWRGKVKAALMENETRERELIDMLKWKQEAYDAE